MKLTSILFIGVFAFSFTIQQATAADNPQGLLDELKAVIAKKDVNAATILIDWGNAPVQAYRMLKMSVADCFAPAKCQIATGPLTEADKTPNENYYFPVAPEGVIRIKSEPEEEGFSMPYAKVNGSYKIVIGQLTEKSWNEVKLAADASKIAKEMASDIVTSGKPLPADGGEPAKAYREYLAAVAKGDTDFLAQHGSQGDLYFFGTAYKANPTKAAITVDLTRMEVIAEPIIKGGFIQDSRAVLLVSGLNGLGWITEGAIILAQKDRKWSIEDHRHEGYPQVMTK